MPVEGYPYSLEIMLEQLNAKGTLSSWQIYEEKQGTVCVRLRYECNGGGQSGVDTKEKISYKRKTKKQMERDYQRAQKHDETGVKTRSKSKMSGDIEMPRCDQTNLEGETTDRSPIGQCDISTPVQVKQSSPANHDTPDSPHLVDPDMSISHDQNKQNCYDQISDQYLTDSGEMQPHLDIPICDIPQLELEETQSDKANICDMCGDVCSSFWRRCSHTDHMNKHFNLCNACYYDECHTEHSDQIVRYIPPIDRQCHCCTSCGFTFKNRTDEVYSCTKCENYLLCVDCFKSSKHKGHAFFIEKSIVGRLY